MPTCRKWSGLMRKLLASAGAFSSRPSNSERAKVRQWSMLWGKECTVHMGACFSGGSRDAPAGHGKHVTTGSSRHPVVAGGNDVIVAKHTQWQPRYIAGRQRQYQHHTGSIPTTERIDNSMTSMEKCAIRSCVNAGHCPGHKAGTAPVCSMAAPLCTEQSHSLAGQIAAGFALTSP